jgi:hypothetical protein
MTIEQRPELNRFVDSSTPLTWAKRWHAFKLTLPIWVFALVCTCETAVLAGWLADKLTLDFVVTIVGSTTVSFLFIWGLIELQVFVEHRSKRVLRIEDKRIAFRPTKNQFMRWKLITKFQFEPVANTPSLTKLRVYGLVTNWPRTERQRWVMIVEQPALVREIIQCLETKRAAAKANFEIRVLEKPVTPVTAKLSTHLEMSLYLGGVYLLLHGVPLLGVALGGGPRHTDETSKMTPTAGSAWEHFVLRHFSSAEQLRYFFLWLGIGLIVAGIALLILGWRLMNRKTQVETASRSA